MKKLSLLILLLIGIASLSINSEARAGMTCCIEGPPGFVCHVISFTDSRGNTSYEFIMGIEVQCPEI